MLGNCIVLVNEYGLISENIRKKFLQNKAYKMQNVYEKILKIDTTTVWVL